MPVTVAVTADAAAIEPGEGEGARCLLAQDQLRDEEAGNDEEDIDPDEPGADRLGERMERNDRRDR